MENQRETPVPGFYQGQNSIVSFTTILHATDTDSAAKHRVDWSKPQLGPNVPPKKIVGQKGKTDRTVGLFASF